MVPYFSFSFPYSTFPVTVGVLRHLSVWSKKRYCEIQSTQWFRLCRNMPFSLHFYYVGWLYVGTVSLNTWRYLYREIRKGTGKRGKWSQIWEFDSHSPEWKHPSGFFQSITGMCCKLSQWSTSSLFKWKSCCVNRDRMLGFCLSEATKLIINYYSPIHYFSMISLIHLVD